MKISFPAMRGQIGQRTYYSCMMQLSVIPKMFTFRDWIEFRPEDREQRVLNQKRVPLIGKYIVDNEDGYIFSSITASYKCDVKFKPHGDGDIGNLDMDFEDANFVVNDGQHRCAAIAHALKENPALGEETISVLLFEYENRERVQQMFSDLNRFVAKTSKSLDILYDKRDPISQATLRICEMVPIFVGMVDKDAVSIGVRSTKLFSLAALYDANKELLRFHADTDEATVNELVRVASEFWEVVSKAVPDWQKVKDQHLRAVELRQESISSHAVVLRAIGVAGGDLMKEHPNDWKSRLLKLTEIDWRKSNSDWEGICIIANSVVSNRQARAATKAYIKQHLGLTLTAAEQRALSVPEFPEKPHDGLEQNDTTWRGDIRVALDRLGGKSTLERLYPEVEQIRKVAERSLPRTWKDIVRGRLEAHSTDSDAYEGGPDIFCMPEGRGAGVWALR